MAPNALIRHEPMVASC